MEKKVRLALFAPEATRRALKIRAAIEGVDMSDLAAVAIDFVLGLLASNKVPAPLRKAIDDAIEEAKSKKAEKKEEEGN